MTDFIWAINRLGNIDILCNCYDDYEMSFIIDLPVFLRAAMPLCNYVMLMYAALEF